MFEFKYSIGDIRNSELGEGIVCLGEGSWGKGGGKWGKGGREVGEKGEGSGGKGGGKWGMPTTLSTPSLLYVKLKDWMSNSVDPDEMAHYEPSHLDLRCLPMSVIIACGSERVTKESKWKGCCSLLNRSKRDNDLLLYSVILLYCNMKEYKMWHVATK